MTGEELIQQELACSLDVDASDLGPTVDLRTLLGELTALKAEVRQQTREVKGTREALEVTASAAPAPPSEARVAARALIDALTRLQAGLERAQAPIPRRWWRPRADDAPLKALIEGLELSCARIEGALSELGVTRRLTINQPFDPAWMEAVSVSRLADQPDGIVLEEIRAGYRDERGALQTAQVVVNRREEPSDG